ncbi:glycoside hydrolase family 16 protein, partial [Roseomonas sp. NAR14]
YFSDASVGVNPYSISDGVLDITMTKSASGTANGQPYTSGLMTTMGSYSQLYGYYEIRAKLPAQQGAFSSFWLTPSDGSWPPEIDIIEVAANDPYTIYSSIHYVNSGQTIGTP